MSVQIVESIKQQLTPFSPGFWFFDGHSVKMDEQARTLLQLDSPEVALEDFLKIIDESSADFLRKFSSSLHADTLVLKFTMKHSPEKWILIQGGVLNRDSSGRVACCSGYCVELRTKFSFPRLFQANEMGIWEWNGITGECRFCESYRAMLGYDAREHFPVTFEEWATIVHPDDLDAVDFQRELAIHPEFGDSFECSIRLRHKNGHYVWTIGSGFVTQRNYLGHAVALRGTNQSVEIIRQKYETSLRDAKLDPMTRMYNRDFFKKEWLEILQSNVFPISFLYIDICGLKMVNDTLGHAQGDRMILTAAELVDKVIQMPKFSIRMGGDEFLIILPNCTAALAAECAKNLKKAQLLRGDQEFPVLFAAGTSSMIIKAELREFISAAEREMQRNKEHSRREDRAFLLDYIERFRGERVSYTDDRINAGDGS